jgi:hypothetical protein
MSHKNLLTKEIKAINTYTNHTEHITLGLIQQIKLHLLNKTPLDHRVYAGWKNNLLFYLYRCKKCNTLHIDYLHGFKNQQYLLCEKQHKPAASQD